MKAIRVEKCGDASVLQLKEIDKPTPGPGQVLVRIKAAGLNFIDIYQRIGRYPMPLPYTPGLEASGVVEAVGPGVSAFNAGDRVSYSSQIGSYAEYNIVPEAILVPLPKEISFEQGAAFPLQGMTAHYLLHEYYQIKKDDTVMIHAAAGGVGLLLVQWAKHLGAKVIGTVSSEEKAAIARAAGADHIIFYSTQNFVEEAKKITAGRGVDFILDGVGKTTLSGSLEAVRTRGTVVLFGSASGPADPIAPNSLQAKSIKLAGGTLFSFIDKREELLKRAQDVLTGISQGWLKLRIDFTLPLKDAAKAHELLESRRSVGKVILKVGEGH